MILYPYHPGSGRSHTRFFWERRKGPQAFIASNPTGPSGHYVGNFGDLTFSERFRLIEQRNFTMLALMTERIPTGECYVLGAAKFPVTGPHTYAWQPMFSLMRNY
jgi:hypothetical protein